MTSDSRVTGRFHLALEAIGVGSALLSAAVAVAAFFRPAAVQEVVVRLAAPQYQQLLRGYEAEVAQQAQTIARLTSQVKQQAATIDGLNGNPTDGPAASAEPDAIVLNPGSPSASKRGFFRAAGSGYLDYSSVPIDFTAFSRPGTLTIEIIVGEGGSCATFDLFPPQGELPTIGPPKGMLVSSRANIPPRGNTTIKYPFPRGDKVRLAATGCWESPKDMRNDYVARVRIDE
jgi:hypothetical protein